MRWFLLIAALSGCVESAVVVCGDGRVCPEGTTCHAALGLCVTAQQAANCEGVADGTACDVTAADEVCFEGVCLPSLCGDGIVGPGEVCDDSNQTDLDGCSSNCKSEETCGNNFTDLTRGEDCDDGNLLDHDGCSSACIAEAPSWSSTPTTPPSGRMAAGIAYDSARDRVILVGGLVNKLTADGVLTLSADDWWEWDGRWRQTRSAAPPPRNFAITAYDEARKRTVFFGGAISGETPETWEYDGVAWKLVAVGGPARFDAAIAYDPIRKHVVIHGGNDPNNSSGIPENDQYEWTGTVWQQRTIPNTLTLQNPRSGASMAFDYKRGKLLLFGGVGTSLLMNDLWEFDGTTWTNKTLNGASGANIPTPRRAAMMAWNATCDCVVLYGGVTGVSTVNADTFTWNGTAWTKITATAGSPPARSYGAMVNDGHGRTLLVGGSKYVGTDSSDVTAYYEDTWVFDGTTWQKDETRQNGAVAYDTDRHRVVMYGASVVGNPTDYSRDTFELSELGWQLRTSTTGPDNVRDASMAYDEARHETVLIGGRQVLNSNAFEPATWIWNGSTWATRTVATQATPTTDGVLVYDGARKELVAFGGSTAAGPIDETWTWNGTTWTSKPGGSPSARDHAAAGFDRTTGQVILFGGGGLDDTWRWDGTTWTQLNGGTQPTPSAVNPLMAWDPARKKLVLLSGHYVDAWEWTGTWWSWLGSLGTRENPDRGMIAPAFDGAGIDVIGGAYYQTYAPGGTYELRWDSAHASDVCRLGEEGDGDTLAACSDPDCWTVCTPGCLPGDTCSQTAPRCGNGTCDAAESCHSCPADCTNCKNVCGDDVCDPGETCPGDCS